MLMFAEIAQAWLAAPSRLMGAALFCITAAQKKLPRFCVSVEQRTLHLNLNNSWGEAGNKGTLQP